MLIDIQSGPLFLINPYFQEIPMEVKYISIVLQLLSNKFPIA